jgi:hypothetical protein
VRGGFLARQTLDSGRKNGLLRFLRASLLTGESGRSGKQGEQKRNASNVRLAVGHGNSLAESALLETKIDDDL